MNMTKGMEATKRLKWGLDITHEERIYLCECIEKELKEYEEMKRIKGTTSFDSALEETLIKACPNVAKKLKALEIIKNADEVEKKIILALFENDVIPQEEYDLLKEVLR